MSRTTIQPDEVTKAIQSGYQRFRDLRDYLDVGADLLRHVLRSLNRQGKIIASSSKLWFVL